MEFIFRRLYTGQKYGEKFGSPVMSTKVCFELKLRAGNSLADRVRSITFVLRPKSTPAGNGTIPQK
jgi:hypothetical protein